MKNAILLSVIVIGSSCMANELHREWNCSLKNSEMATSVSYDIKRSPRGDRFEVSTMNVTRTRVIDNDGNTEVDTLPGLYEVFITADTLPEAIRAVDKQTYAKRLAIDAGGFMQDSRLVFSAKKKLLAWTEFYAGGYTTVWNYKCKLLKAGAAQ